MLSWYHLNLSAFHNNRPYRVQTYSSAVMGTPIVAYAKICSRYAAPRPFSIKYSVPDFHQHRLSVTYTVFTLLFTAFEFYTNIITQLNKIVNGFSWMGINLFTIYII